MRVDVWLASRIAALCLLVLLPACSVEENYETLSFFFDGVPDPNQKQEEAEPMQPSGLKPGDYAQMSAKERASLLAVRVEVPTIYQHEPVLKRLCHECHGRSRPGEEMSFTPGMPTLLEAPEKLCGKCHEPPSGAYIHGPAGSGFCIACHMPHRSPNQFLLVEADRIKLCSRCHTGDTFVSKELHAPVGEIPCTECHDPHAAERVWQLHPEAPLLDAVPAAEPPGEMDDEGGRG